MELTKEQQSIVEKVHDFVKSESEKSPINDEIDIFDYHILNVVRFSKMLAERCNANKFVVTVAAYLHDITFIRTSDHDTHEVEGSKFARDYLSQFSLPSEEIDLICSCILNHRGSKNPKKESVEEKIVASADAMDHIDRCLTMFFRSRGNLEESIKFMQGKIKRGWDKIELQEARDIIKPKFEAAKVLFEIE